MKDFEFYKKKTINRVRINQSSMNGLIELHRNISPNQISEDKFNLIVSKILIKDLSKYPDLDLLIHRVSEHNCVHKDNILITSGIDGGLKTIFEMCVSAGDKVATYTPTYAMYSVYAEAYDVEIIPIVINPETLMVNLEDVLCVLNDDISVLFLPNPNMPIETAFSVKHLETIVSSSYEHGVLVVIDEAYNLFGCETIMPMINKYNNLIVARTFSKGMGLPGIRLGYLAGNSNLISYLHSRRYAHETNSLSAAVGIWALDNFEEIMKNNHEIISTREWFKQKLSKYGFKCSGSLANTVIIDLINSDNAKVLVSGMKDKGYIIRGNYPLGYERFVSVAMGSRQQMEKVAGSIVGLIELKESEES